MLEHIMNKTTEVANLIGNQLAAAFLQIGVAPNVTTSGCVFAN
jgi:hypothetical protein